MQISRTQNQPNFKSRVKTINPNSTALHLQIQDVKTYSAKKKALKAIGDDHTAFGIAYNPRNIGPFGLLGQIVSPKTGETTVRFKDGLHLSQLAECGEQMYKEMTQELGAKPVYPRVRKTKEQLQEDVAEITR